MTTATAEPQATTEKQDPPYFADRAERENYYRWVYCVKHGITDMESYGVKPLGLANDATPTAIPAHTAEVMDRAPARPRGGTPNAINLEMSKPVVAVLIAASGVINFCYGTMRLFWNLLALMSAIAIAMALLGVATA